MHGLSGGKFAWFVILGLGLALGARAEDEEEQEAPAPQPAAKPAARPRPLQIEKAAHPYRLPEGPSRAAWELFVKNDSAGAEKAFREVLDKEPKDLEALEGLRGTFISDGRYSEAQDVNLRMIAAAADTPLCQAFAQRATEALGLAAVHARLEECLVQSSANAPPPVRAILRDFLASLYYNTDRPQEARKAVEGLGYLERWLFVAGPFGFSDRSNSMERRFAPERPLKSLAFKDERNQTATVRENLPVSFRSLNLSLLFPGAHGIFYAFTNLESDRDQEVLLLTGAPEATHVYLRGLPVLQEVLSEQYPRNPPVLRTRLLKGSNPLLVKLPSAGELAVRILAPDHAPATGISVAPLPPDALARHEILPVRGFLFSQPARGALAEHFLQRGKPDEQAQGKGLATPASDGSLSLPQALWLEQAAREEDDPPAREAVARTLIGSYPDSVALLDTAAAVLSQVGRAGGHAESRYQEESRQLRERALERVPTSHQHLLGLYYFFQGRNLMDQALEKLKACVEAHPKSALALERLGQADLSKGLRVQAQQLFERAAALDPAYLSSLARFHEQYGDRAKAREIEARLAQLGLVSRLSRFEELLSRGQLDEAEKILRLEEQAYPERADSLLGMRAELALERDPQAALELRKKLVERQPKNRQALVDYVDLALRLKKDDEARERMKAYLKEHPSDFELRRRLGEAEGHGGERWWEPYDIRVESIDTSQFNQERYPRSNHAWIVDFMVVKVFPDYSRESYVHIAQKVLNQDGINELSEVLVRAQRHDLVMLRTLNPDGSSYQPENVHNFNLAQSASFLKVGPGSVLEHAYLEHEEADEIEPRLSMGFNFMALDAPRAVSRWVVMLPKSLKVETRKICPDLVDEKILPGPEGYVVYQWTNKQVEGIKQEPFMPEEGDREVIPLVFVESPERPYRASGWLVRNERLFLPEAAAAQARELTGKAATDEEKFRLICEWVRTHIQPGREARTLDDVWTLRSGHAGQMTDLALAMCRALGLKVSSALVNGAYLPGRNWVSKNAPRTWEPGYFANFGSAGRMLVLECPKAVDTWLQFAGQPATYYALQDLMDPQPGALALCLGEDGVRVKQVDAELLGRAPVTHRAAVTLDEQGGGAVRGTLRFTGLIGGRLRQLLSDPRRTAQVQQELVRRLWPQIEPGEFKMENEPRPALPLIMVYSGNLRDFAAHEGPAFTFPPFQAPSNLQQLQGPPERVHDLVLKPEMADRFTELDVTWSYEAPPGFGWVEAPDDLFVCTEFGFYVVDFNVKGRVLTCSRSYLVPAQRVLPAKYPQFMEFLRKIAEFEQQRVAYARLDFPGCAGMARAVFSQGYASYGYDAGDGAAAGKPPADAKGKN